jgi:MYXO-CTERM domain-containing protein
VGLALGWVAYWQIIRINNATRTYLGRNAPAIENVTKWPDVDGPTPRMHLTALLALVAVGVLRRRFHEHL